MALIRKASAMSSIGQLCAFPQEALGEIDPPVLQIAIGAGTKQCPEISRKLPPVTARSFFKFIQSRTEDDGGFEKFARPHHGWSVGGPYRCSLARHVVHRLRQIVERIFIKSTGILFVGAVIDHIHGRRDQDGIRRYTIDDKRQFRASKRCSEMSGRNIGCSVAETSLIAAVSIVYFFGMED